MVSQNFCKHPQKKQYTNPALKSMYCMFCYFVFPVIRQDILSKSPIRHLGKHIIPARIIFPAIFLSFFFNFFLYSGSFCRLDSLFCGIVYFRHSKLKFIFCLGVILRLSSENREFHGEAVFLRRVLQVFPLQQPFWLLPLPSSWLLPFHESC